MTVKELSEAYAPSGIEKEVRQIITNELSDFYPDIKVDNLGNIIIHKPGKMKSISITAPMDEVSFLISHQPTEYIAAVTSICDVKPISLQNFKLKDEFNNIFVSNKNTNLSEKLEKIKDLEVSVLNICKAKKLNMQNVSKQLVYSKECLENDDFITGKALERSIACLILCDIARKLVDSLYEYYFIFSVQNYCDRKGALTASYQLKIDELYNICGIDADKNENIECGKGPVLVLRDKKLVSSKELIEKFDKCKEKQLLVTEDFICEGGCYSRQPETTSYISLGFPIKNMLCPNEIVNISDFERIKKTLFEIVLP